MSASPHFMTTRSETDQKGDALPLFFFTPFRAVISQLVFIQQERINALIHAKNEIQIEVATRMFPGSMDCQVACLCSEMCRLRIHKLLLAKPWYLSWYILGFHESVIGLVMNQICSHRKCGTHRLLTTKSSSR